jgi:uncharacterized cofD-like protein
MRPDPAPATRIVALGGGSGLPILLRGLKRALFPVESPDRPHDHRDRLTAIVTVADDGGSSGRLRRAYGVLAPGDIRNCLIALADGDPALAAVFGFRFNGHGALSGHSLGNLILTALSQLEDEFPAAVERASDMLGIWGRVLPATSERVHLVAEYADGRHVEGESRIAAVRGAIRCVRLRPPDARALPAALAAIHGADRIVIGPGSLYTSLLPVLLVPDLADAIARSGARVALVMNLMTEPGETDAYTAVDHLEAIRRHAPQVPIHDVLVNVAPAPPAIARRLATGGRHRVEPRVEELRAMGCGAWEGELLSSDPMRHDPRKLAAAVVALGPEQSGLTPGHGMPLRVSLRADARPAAGFGAGR